MSWRPIDELKDDDKIYAGALIRFYNKEKAVSDGAALWVEPTNYIVSQIYANTDYFQLTCLSKGRSLLYAPLLLVRSSTSPDKPEKHVKTALRNPQTRCAQTVRILAVERSFSVRNGRSLDFLLLLHQGKSKGKK